MNSTTVTREPRRAKACASSRPIGPPPRTIRRSGSRRWEKTVSLVHTGRSASPSTGGSTGLDPVAMIQAFAETGRPSTATRWLSTKTGCPEADLRPQAAEPRGGIVLLDPVDDAPDAVHDRPEFHRRPDHVRQAELLQTAGLRPDARRPDQGLRGDAAHVEAVPAQPIGFFDEDGPGAELRPARRRRQSRRAAPDHPEIVIICRH